ncbi:MAG: LPS-assembly protein LptD [Thermoanaerobaculia bacterium]
MRHDPTRFFMLLIAAVSLLLSPAGFSQAPPTSTKTQFKKFKYVPPTVKKGGELRYTIAKGGRIEAEKDEYMIFEGGVKIEYQDVTLQSDKLTFNQKTHDAVAEGHVVIDQGQTRIAATQGVFNLESKTGTFFNAQATLENSLYFTGERIEKINEDTYRLENGVFTSCDLDRPAWSFHIRRADITLDSYAHLKDVSFRAGGVPIFWTPRLLWPTKKDRSQGVLIPRIFLNNGNIGERLELGYFVPFGDSVDTTVYADLNTKGYNGGGFDLRYLPSPNVKLGNLSAYAVRDVDPNFDGIRAPGESKMQWKYQYQHSQDNLPGGFRGVVDVQDYSDLDFFRKWDHDPRLNSLSNIYSSAYLTKNRPTFSFNFLTDRRDIYLGHVTTDPSSPVIKQRFEQLPSLQFRMYPQRILSTPLYFSMESSASHLVTSGLVNGPSANYNREDIFPTLSLQLSTPAWFSVKPQISVRGTHYSSSLDPDTLDLPGSQQKTIDEALNRYYGQGQVEVVGPTVSRVFAKSIGGFTRFKHIIEPRFRYIYTTDVNDQNRVIRFDTVDSPFLPIVRDSVEYSLTQRLLGKGSGDNASPREVMSFTLRQTVSLSKPFTSSTGGNLPGSPFTAGAGQKFTPLSANLHVNPYQSVTLDATATFGNVSHQLDQLSLSTNLVGTGAYADKYLGFSWFASFLQPGQTVGDSSQVRVNGGSSFWSNHLRADVQFALDTKASEILEQRYLIGGNGSCYGLAIEYRRYLVFDPLRRFQRGIGLAVTLKNVGTIGTH